MTMHPEGKKIDLSVVIPTLNRDSDLRNTLKDLFRQTGEYALEIMVMDQNATPLELRHQELASLITSDERVRVTPCAGKGLVYARNLGIRLSTGRVVVFLDDDIAVEDPHFLWKHFKAHNELPNVAAVCGCELNKHSPNLVEGISYERRTPISDILFFPRNCSLRVEATVLSTCNCSIKRDALLAVQCFDESFIGASYGDDADLALRLNQAGYKIYYDPTPTLFHLRTSQGGLRLTSSNRLNPFSHTERAVSSFVFYLKHLQGSRQYRWFYIYHYVLRKTILLKSNVVRFWRLPAVFVGLINAYITAKNLVKKGHKFSFGI